MRTEEEDPSQPDGWSKKNPFDWTLAVGPGYEVQLMKIEKRSNRFSLTSGKTYKLELAHRSKPTHHAFPQIDMVIVAPD